MINYLLCGLGVWVLMGLLMVGYECAPQQWASNLCQNAIYLPLSIIFYSILYFIVFPCACIWKFFRNAIKGVSVECWEKFNAPPHLKFGCFRLCHDKTARKWCNRFFLVRIVKPSEEIKHKFEKK